MMINLRNARLGAITPQIGRIFSQYSGSKSSSKFNWGSESKTKSKYAGVLVGIGCSVATLASIGYALDERREDDTSLDNGWFKNTIGNRGPSCSFDQDERKAQLEAAIKKSRLKLEQVKEESGSPGLVCAVSIDGKLAWTVGLGFADVENGVRCHDGTVMRIASISKALTSIAVGKLLQDSKIDLNMPVQQYVEYFPEKEFNGEGVIITLRQLMSHTSGVRHYEKELCENDTSSNENVEKIKEKNKNEKIETKDINSLGKTKYSTKEAGIQSKADREVGEEGKRNNYNLENSLSKQKQEEFRMKEYYIKDHFDSVKDAISIFKDDPLLKKPGSDYLYTTHGWTLISACIEGASGEDYIAFMKSMCYDLGLDNTVVECNDPIVYNRSNCYTRDTKGKLKNTPYVDNSYKWAGGGFLSTVGDLVKIGNVMLYSSQCEDQAVERRGYLRKDVVDLFWTPEPVTVGKVSKKRKEACFGLGWQLLPTSASYGCCRETKFAAMHSGAAVGASSILLIVPKDARCDGCKAVKVDNSKDPSQSQMINKCDRQRGGGALIENNSNLLMKKISDCREERGPQGIVVAIMVNMQEVGLSDTALEIAENFIFEL